MAVIEEHDFSAFSQKQRKQLLDAINNQLPTVAQTETNKTLTSPTITTPTMSLVKDASGYYYRGSVSSVPASGTAGYAVGCILTLTACVLGQHANWINMGTAASCIFVPYGYCNGYAFEVVSSAGVASAGGDATEVITDTRVVAGDLPFITVDVCDDNDQICGAVCTLNTITLTVTADPVAGNKEYNYAIPRDNAIGEYDIFAAGTYDCVTADDTTVAITVAGVLSTDIAFVNYTATDDNDLVSDVVCTTNTVTITVSADPGTDGTHSWSYMVLRKRGTFTPSHYIAYCGTHTSAGGDAVEVVTVTGALATDIPIVCFGTTDDTDTFEKVVVTANTLTITLDADPGAGNHTFNYMLLREYS